MGKVGSRELFHRKEPNSIRTLMKDLWPGLVIALSRAAGDLAMASGFLGVPPLLAPLGLLLYWTWRGGRFLSTPVDVRGQSTPVLIFRGVCWGLTYRMLPVLSRHQLSK